MILLAAVLLLEAAPPSCDALWTRVAAAAAERTLAPGARERWIAACRRFSPEALACARGETHEAELKAIDRRLFKEGVAAPARKRHLEELRSLWTPLECAEVARALEPITDGGVPSSDDCAGEALRTGRCACAHHQGVDQCCPAGWVCAHTGAESSKCLRPAGRE